MDSMFDAILSSVASYQTVNILELMSLTPGIDESNVRQTVASMNEKSLVKLSGDGEDQMVSLTNKGYDYLNSRARMLSVI